MFPKDFFNGNSAKKIISWINWFNEFTSKFIIKTNL